eukprot:390734_1
MTTKDENQVDHTETDTLLKRTFTNEIIPKLLHDPYKTLLKIRSNHKITMTNPTQLEFEMRRNGMKRVVLRDADFKRAQEQAQKVQSLNFPLKYQAMCRLFYCSFQSSKGRIVWDDHRNSGELNEHLQLKCPQIKPKQSKSSPKTKRAPKGRAYCETSGGKKLPLKRKYYRGPKGGIYYETASGGKVYLKPEAIKALQSKVSEEAADVKYDDEKTKDKTPSSANTTGYSYKGRAVYKGAKGGLYYVTASGYKTYVAAEDVQTTKKKPKSSASKGRQYYRGTRGGIYYLTASGNKHYSKPDEIKQLNLI